MGELYGQPAEQRITETASAAMRAAIAEAGGREVFFCGILNDQGLIGRVDVRARGHHGAVPAQFDGLPPGSVVIHNHPSGNLEPSDADLELAAAYSHNGFGVFIVDNEAARVYAVIEPYRDAGAKAIDVGELQALLTPGGSVAKQFKAFEERPQQVEMLRVVAESFNRNGISVVEAPTGVGKTLAYLVPAIEWALNNRERVVVSTRTINLQEQILFKDVPVLRKALGRPFKAVLVKGRQNYLCRRRLERAISEAGLFADESEKDTLNALAEWAEKTEEGSLSDLSYVPKRELWEQVCADADTCTAAQCQEQKNCFLSKARREVAQADIIVVNHHMLFSDLAIKQELGSFSALAVLPAFTRLILDEAHHLEDSATEYFGGQATQLGAMTLLGRISRRERNQARGLVPFLLVRLADNVPSQAASGARETETFVEAEVLPAIGAARQSLTSAFQALRAHVSERCRQVGRDIKWRLTPDVLPDEDLRAIHRDYVLEASQATSSLGQLLSLLGDKLVALQKDYPEDRNFSLDIQQLQAYSVRLLRLANTLAEATSPDIQEKLVRWIEIDADRTEIVRVLSCPLNVAESMAEWVYPNLKTMAMTSATLTVNNKFDFFLKRTGVERIEGRHVETLQLNSPFNFETQAFLCVPNDLPAPVEQDFGELSVHCMRRVLEAAGGRAFILFTSFAALNHAYSRLESDLRAQGITALKQGADTRSRLLERFRADTQSVLFGTDSFWEGVDVIGDALQCVILPRLPFRVPTEPILEARAEMIESQGGNAFMEYTVPLAVIKFRQGFGRLIRSGTDKGSVVVLDNRMLTRHYGKIFLKSLPPMPRHIGPQDMVIPELEQFHKQLSESRT